jgi:hypothetical protein
LYRGFLLHPSFHFRFHRDLLQGKMMLVQKLEIRQGDSSTNQPLPAVLLLNFELKKLVFAGSALNALKSEWTNAPSSWSSASDPCDGGWDGVMCSNGRVTSL